MLKNRDSKQTAEIGFLSPHQNIPFRFIQIREDMTYHHFNPFEKGALLCGISDGDSHVPSVLAC